MPVNKDAEPVAGTRIVVTAWLAKEDWNSKQLTDWLQGYDLPAFGHSDEPYLWLLRGIPEAEYKRALNNDAIDHLHYAA